MKKDSSQGYFSKFLTILHKNITKKSFGFSLILRFIRVHFVKLFLMQENENK